jgi:membrane-bound ClpP family serine protease
MARDDFPFFLSAANGTITMVLLEGIALGWLLIVIGAVLLLVEVQSPGFFATVPATVMIIFGILLLLGMDIFNNGWGIVIGVIVAIAAAGFTVWMYSRVTTDESPTTISRDSIVGREGRVIKDVNPDTLSGKVMIGSTEWSAKSTGLLIPPGRNVKVVDSQGVHIIVEEVA